MSGGELGQITAPTMFCWGTGDPFLAPAQARPAIAKIPGAVLHEVPGGHGPWLEDPAGCAGLTVGHLAATGFAPAAEHAILQQSRARERTGEHRWEEVQVPGVIRRGGEGE